MSSTSEKPKSRGKASAVRRTVLRRLIALDKAKGGEVGGEEAYATGRRERAQMEQLYRGVLKHRIVLDRLIAREELFDPRRTARPLRWILRIAAYEKIYLRQSPDYAIGEQATALAKSVAGPRGGRFVNAVVRRLLERLPEDPERLKQDPFWGQLEDWERWSIPEEIVSEYFAAYGEEPGRAVLSALAERTAPVWLRVNTLRISREALIRRLETEEVEVEADPIFNELMVWKGGRLPWETEAWEAGLMTIQDWASVLVGRVVAPSAGERVLDLCAAPGGKTGHLWEQMQGEGELQAWEIDPGRRKELRHALDRLFGADHSIQLLTFGSLQELISTHAEAFDRVLIDAPCQGLGLIGRHPEIRWDNRLKHREKIIRIQQDLLAGGAKLVRPGGRLIWATCSPTKAENEGIVLPWLEDHPEWRVDVPPDALPAAAREVVQVSNEGFLRTRPDQVVCDGFAMGILRRNESSSF